MSRITRYTFENAFADRLVSGPQRLFRDDSKLYRLLETPTLSPFGTMTVQCCSHRVAERLLRDREAQRATEREFFRLYDRVDFSHTEIGPTLALSKIASRAPIWSELRPWLEESLIGRISAYVGAKETRLSFADEGDYALARLAWG